MFSSFTPLYDTVSTEPKQNPANEDNLNNLTAKSLEDPKPPRKDTFQVKSGIWADSLSRGLIDLNITAPKKVNLADVGIVGGLSDTDERGKGPPTSFTWEQQWVQSLVFVGQVIHPHKQLEMICSQLLVANIFISMA
ncbi:hypothetical protein SLEP1_g21416 [Rubroshorea leprosula]|uniref:Uncharacterized protein n=1 Tax=Rubroshorea leprosula TaxID=152421 RepID=A0AAV5JBW7_9ROSI|nr:hypothetical protein SLEP1_g21416 [Rubroshorea leprosula]